MRQATVAEQAPSEVSPKFVGSVVAVVGGVVTYNAWGSWWVLLGIVLLLAGVSIFFIDPDE